MRNATREGTLAELRRYIPHSATRHEVDDVDTLLGVAIDELRRRITDHSRNHPKIKERLDVMPFREITDAEQLTLLTTVLDNYCQEKGIGALHPRREELGRFLVALYGSGMRNPTKLKAALDDILARRQLSSH